MKNNEKIKIGILVSYDYQYLEKSLPRLYDYADEITLALDKDRKTWGGNDFQIPESFFSWIRDFDKKNKIKIYEDTFYIEGLSGTECETRERNMLAQFMGEGGWHFQIDTDEYFLDFEKVVDFAHSLDYSKKVLVYAKWSTIFKKDEEGYYLIEPHEYFNFLTNYPHYNYCRGVEGCDEKIYTDFLVLHESWGRSEEEIYFKIKNWGHKEDFNAESYYKFWKQIDKTTYKYARSFNPLFAWHWQYLVFYEATEISKLIDKVKEQVEIMRKESEESNKIKLRDFIPVALYKIKSKIFSK